MERNLIFKRILISTFLFFIFYFYGFLYSSFPPNPGKGLYPFRVKKGESVSEISYNLKREGIIKNDFLFKFFSVLVREEHRFSAGLYFLDKGMNELLCFKSMRFKFSLLSSVRITIPEGYTVEDISKILSKELDLSYDTIYSFFTSPEKLEPIFKNFNIEPVKTLEGYIFPDTYILPSGCSPFEIAIKGLARLTEVLKELGYDTLKTQMSLHEVLTLASIVEKEAVYDFEKPIIASVFLNRLEKGLPLQADPTVRYILKKRKGRLYFEDLKFDSPYNTYIYRGLPPGPICCPGKSSIKAVLYPAKTDYLYFVAKGDGTHYFSKSFREHREKKFIYKERWNF